MDKEKPGTPLWKALLLQHRLPWRYKVMPWTKKDMRLIDYIFFKNINRMLLALNPLSKYAKDDINILIPVKNRCDYKLVNALKSIRSQDYDQELINISVIDYDSQKEFIQKFKEICKRFNAKYIRIENRPGWCKSHALNVVIKKTKTKYILSTDVDMILEKNYISEAIKELRRNPYQIVLSNFLKSNQGAIVDEVDVVKDYDKFKEKCIVMCSLHEDNLNPGINMSLTHFYKKIKGYDEKYQLWGFEDNDLIKRFGLLGLKISDISNKTSFIHQWHSKYEGTVNQEYEKQRKENFDYFKKNYSVKRNKKGWGEL